MGLRVSEDEEIKGLDLSEHGTGAYGDCFQQTIFSIIFIIKSVEIDVFDFIQIKY